MNLLQRLLDPTPYEWMFLEEVRFEKQSLRPVSCLFHKWNIRRCRELKIGKSGLCVSKNISRAAQLQISFRELESILRFNHRIETLLRGTRKVIRQQVTVRLQIRSSNASAQLVNLREPESFRTHNHHHSCVRHVDTNFDNGCRDKNVNLAVAKIFIALLLLIRLQLSMERRDA